MLAGCEIVAASGCVISGIFSSSSDKVENIFLPDAKVGKPYQATELYISEHRYIEQTKLVPKVINGLNVEVNYSEEQNYLVVSGIPIVAGEFDVAQSMSMLYSTMCSPSREIYYYYKLKIIE